MLEYHVESSDKYHIYKVKFDGEGENLIAHCSCPAGKKAGLFCKHIASLLNGDESIIIEPSNKIDELKILSKNSALLEKAKTYIPYDKRSEHYRSKLLDIKIKNIKDIDNYIESYFEGTIYWKEYENKEDGAEYLKIYVRKYYKNGKPYKNPTILSYIQYEPFQYSNWDENGNYSETIVKCADKKMPFAVNWKSFGYIETASKEFIDYLKIIKEEH